MPGRWSLLLSWLPVAGDPLTVAGTLREPLWSFVMLVTVAKTARYLAIAAATLSWIWSDMLQWVIEVQRDIYLAFAEHIKTFAEDGSWAALAAFLPMGIVFGAVHAMTPGHSKSVLATYLTGSSAGLGRSLTVSLVLSFTHVTSAVLIALLSLPLVSIALGSVGQYARQIVS